LGLAKTALVSNFSELSEPYKLNFSVTYMCQSRCQTCNIWQIMPKNELTLDEIRKFAEKNTSFRWIELTGGEPFLRSDIVEIARTFAENSKNLYILTMPTNSLCNSDMVFRRLEEILSLGIPRVAITISLDGYEELHDRIRGVKGNYQRAIYNFKRLQELKKKYKNLFFIFGYTMSTYNQGEFEKTFEAVKRDIPDITYNDFHVNLGQISSIYYGNKEMNLKADSNATAGEIRKIVERRERRFDTISLIEDVFLRKLANYAETGNPPMKSKSLDASLFMDSYGNIYPSIMWERKIGNVREIDYDLKRVWHSQEAKEIRAAIRERSEPKQWTSCEAYQSITGNILSFVH
jgi:MoaA/NifB/PqqE/SkfB family radical SAM enzyme